MKRTCDELGVCQAEVGKSRCPGCTPHAYAPGTIEAYRRPGVHLRHAVAAMLLSAALGVVAGYARAKGWL